MLYNVTINKNNKGFNEDFLRIVLRLRDIRKIEENRFIVDCNDIDAEVLRHFGCRVKKVKV